MILLQIYFRVDPINAVPFEHMYRNHYAPALARQEGYVSSRLLSLYSAQVAEEIGAAPTPFNYQIELAFDTEEARRRWASGDDHAVVWPLAQALAEEVAWRGFTVVA